LLTLIGRFAAGAGRLAVCIRVHPRNLRMTQNAGAPVPVCGRFVA